MLLIIFLTTKYIIRNALLGKIFLRLPMVIYHLW